MERPGPHTRTAGTRPVRGLIPVGLVLLALLVPPVGAVSAARPGLQDFTAAYALFRNDSEIGIAERRLATLPDGRREYRSHARAIPPYSWFAADHIRESSIFMLRQGRLRPLHYRYDRTGGSREEHYEVVFDWRADETRYLHDDTEHPLPGDIADLLSFQIDLMLQLRRGKEYVNFTLALKDGLQGYAFRRREGAQWQLSDGTLKVVRVAQIPNERPERFTLWVAPSLGYLPVRIERRKNGRTTAFELRRYNGRLFERVEDEDEE